MEADAGREVAEEGAVAANVEAVVEVPSGDDALVLLEERAIRLENVEIEGALGDQPTPEQIFCETTRYFMGEELLLRKGCPRNVLPSLLRLLIVNPLPTDYLADEKNGDEAGAIASENVSVEDFKHAIIVSACELWASKEFYY